MINAGNKQWNAGMFENRLKQSSEIGGLCTQAQADAQEYMQQKPEAPRQIPRAIMEQEKVVALLAESVSQLRRKVAQLIPPLPAGPECGEKDCEAYCEVAGRIHSNTVHVSVLATQINELTQLIEL